ncbi:unnamed protein product [Phytophthora fragariaefolia]|uniref:Unnamed protein product n=1 Tax=Phytophthora fragariaefolia TaxID=1490495 RepID=A0A9W6Y1X2_9STRA|nr:unnamed protein product [Phytophthora fragariaefolia]
MKIPLRTPRLHDPLSQAKENSPLRIPLRLNPLRDTQDPKSSASATPPTQAPQERSPPPEDGPDPVDYEESEPDQDREQGEVPDPNSSPQLSDQQRVTHPGSPMTPKTAAAGARVEAQAQGESHRDTAPTDMPEQQIITNAGIDEGVPPEQLHVALYVEKFTVTPPPHGCVRAIRGLVGTNSTFSTCPTSYVREKV